MLKKILAVVAIFGFAGSAFAQAPAPTGDKNTKPAVGQPAPGKPPVAKKAYPRPRKAKKSVTRTNGAASPAPGAAPVVPATPATPTK
jgi:hypothetical protein